MKGNEVAKLVRRHKGKVYVKVHTGDDVLNVAAEKQDLCNVLLEYGDRESGLEFRTTNGVGYVDREF